MLHYVVAFTFRDDVVEADALQRVDAFLSDLALRNAIAGYTLRRSRPGASPAPARFTADILFVDDAQFGVPFAEVRASGVHYGMHGVMIELVAEMSVEVLEEIPRERSPR